MQKSNPDRSVLILFSPKVLPVIDLFRGLAELEENYSSPLLEEQEGQLAALIGSQQARAALSDALLLSFELKRQRRSLLAFSAVGSRQGSVEEFCLLALIAAAGFASQPLFVRAATVLNIEPTETLRRLSLDLSKRLSQLFLEGDFTDINRFEAVVGGGPQMARDIVPDDSSIKFYF
ncbi:hypothetical protein [Microvirga flavescens]|uniref:hypothetical protein n=1 Tax=Microvirga flavescens TaxID=2249811 RepID=UPI00130050C5|nr:hypothetical protein [Microvirga flavescens]